MAGRRPIPRGDSPPQSEQIPQRTRPRPRTGPAPPTVFTSGGNDPLVEIMRQLYMQPAQMWQTGQHASPTRYPETTFWPAEQAGQRRQFNEGQRQATYTPPSQARIAAAPLRQYSQGQRQPVSDRRLHEAIVARPTNLPALNTMDPARFQEMANLYLAYLAGQRT